MPTATIQTTTAEFVPQACLDCKPQPRSTHQTIHPSLSPGPPIRPSQPHLSQRRPSGGEVGTLRFEDRPGVPLLQDESWSQDSCLQVGSAYVIVYSIADRGSFESASELRIQLRRTHQADHVPIILVGNKADLARCREVSVEGEPSTPPSSSSFLSAANPNPGPILHLLASA